MVIVSMSCPGRRPSDALSLLRRRWRLASRMGFSVFLVAALTGCFDLVLSSREPLFRPSETVRPAVSGQWFELDGNKCSEIGNFIPSLNKFILIDKNNEKVDVSFIKTSYSGFLIMEIFNKNDVEKSSYALAYFVVDGIYLFLDVNGDNSLDRFFMRHGFSHETGNWKRASPVSKDALMFFFNDLSGIIARGEYWPRASKLVRRCPL